MTVAFTCRSRSHGELQADLWYLIELVHIKLVFDGDKLCQFAWEGVFRLKPIDESQTGEIAKCRSE